MTELLNAHVEILQQSGDYAKFQVEPLDRGFGLTLGNALRRVLLSSLRGAAVTAVRIERVSHEFATLPGVKEDTTELLLNLKQLRMKSHTDQPVALRLEAQGPGVVTAADLIYPSEIEIANPELQIATLDSPEARLDMELTVERGTGFLSADGRENVPLGVIPMDAVFTPIKRVNYTVESARVGARTDLDRLIVEILTDGTITPTSALVSASRTLIDQFALFDELQQPARRSDKQGLGSGPVPSRVFDMPIEQLELSQRTYNCLKRSQITKVGQILTMSEDELLSLRNFGQKSLTELREKLREHGVIEDDGTEVTSPAASAEAGVDDDEDTDEEAG
ncbi:MAG: DNA-directed RNA polymerase subunit alpha [Chloroflexi bacterium]|nr:DNA-directed RNA polymerase subunit alpha [Chloroflexota bacterium]